MPTGQRAAVDTRSVKVSPRGTSSVLLHPRRRSPSRCSTVKIRQAVPTVTDPFQAVPGRPSRYLYSSSVGSIALCIVLWIRAKTLGEDERGNAERRAIFVGLWPPMFWLMGDTARRAERRRRRLVGGRRLRRS